MTEKKKVCTDEELASTTEESGHHLEAGSVIRAAVSGGGGIVLGIVLTLLFAFIIGGIGCDCPDTKVDIVSPDLNQEV